MLETAKSLVGLNRYNPKIYYMLEDEIEKVVTYSKSLPAIPREVNELYEDLKKYRFECYNDLTRTMFPQFCNNVRTFDFMSVLRTNSLEVVLNSLALMQELQSYCNNVIANQSVGYGQNKALNSVINCAVEFMRLAKEKDEDMWNYYHYLEKMVIRGLRRNTLYKQDLKDVLPIIRQGLDIKRNIINDYFKDNDLKREIYLHEVNLMDKFLDDRKVLNEYIETVQRDLLNRINTDPINSEKIYNIFVGAKLQYIENLKVDVGDVYLEYVELQILGLPNYLMYYRTPEEIFNCFRECTAFLKTFNISYIKEKVIKALYKDGEGLYKRYSSTDFLTFAENNLQILANYGVLTPAEYMEVYNHLFGE